MYGTPTIGGSRSGGVVAATWCAMVSVGEEGYVKAAQLIMDATKVCMDAVERTKGVKVMGNPKMSIFAMESDESGIDIFHVSAAMAARGWSLNNWSVLSTLPCKTMRTGLG